MPAWRARRKRSPSAGSIFTCGAPRWSAHGGNARPGCWCAPAGARRASSAPASLPTDASADRPPRDGAAQAGPSAGAYPRGWLVGACRAPLLASETESCNSVLARRWRCQRSRWLAPRGRRPTVWPQAATATAQAQRPSSRWAGSRGRCRWWPPGPLLTRTSRWWLSRPAASGLGSRATACCRCVPQLVGFYLLRLRLSHPPSAASDPRRPRCCSARLRSGVLCSSSCSSEWP